jgi:hypothetical protein
MTDDHPYRVLKHLAAHPNATQRELAAALGISLGSTNFCVRADIHQGWVKVQNFRRSDHKRLRLPAHAPGPPGPGPYHCALPQT